jgi:hypothetical protein
MAVFAVSFGREIAEGRFVLVEKATGERFGETPVRAVAKLVAQETQKSEDVRTRISSLPVETPEADRG